MSHIYADVESPDKESVPACGMQAGIKFTLVEELQPISHEITSPFAAHIVQRYIVHKSSVITAHPRKSTTYAL